MVRTAWGGLVAVGLGLLACDADETTTEAATSTASSGGASATVTTVAATVGSGGAGGSGGAMLIPYDPTPATVGFEAKNPLPDAEQILFNDWNAPDKVLTMAPDGSGAQEVFSIHRVWSMAVSRDGAKVAVSCGVPNQVDHYGLTIGDSIQHVWLYDVATQTIENVVTDAVNDECLVFDAAGDLKLCRRYDFTNEGTFKGYVVGALDLPSGDFTFITMDEPTAFTLNPTLTSAGDIWFTRIDIIGGSQQRSIQKIEGGASPALVRNDATTPRISPDGTRYLYGDTSQGQALFAADVAGGGETQLTDDRVTSFVWSPDGTRVAFLVDDVLNNCADVVVVMADGSDKDTPTTVRDCSTTGEFITELAWVDRSN